MKLKGRDYRLQPGQSVFATIRDGNKTIVAKGTVEKVGFFVKPMYVTDYYRIRQAIIRFNPAVTVNGKQEVYMIVYYDDTYMTEKEARKQARKERRKKR